MGRLQTYRAIRELGRQIHSDALKDVPKSVFLRGAERLGMMGKGKVLLFDSEDETDVLAQFLLYEIPQGEKPIIQHHLDKRGAPQNTMEEELFRAIRDSFSSLFRIETGRGEGIVVRNLLTPDEGLHTLVDIGLIQTARAGFLLFTRLLPLREYAITGGVSFPFAGHHETALSKEDLKLRKSARQDELSMRRYVVFHRLGKTMGLPMEFGEPAG